MRIIKEFVQQSEAWFAWRGGKITSTGAKALTGYKEMLKAELMEVAGNYEFDEGALKKMKVDELKTLIFANDPDFETRKMVYKSDEDFAYRMLAHELSDGTAPDEIATERGHRLEPVAREAFAKEYKKDVVEVGGLERSDEPRICMSPDGVIFDGSGEKVTESTEIKALAGWRHVKIWLTDTIPADHKEQCIDYFVVNDDLDTLYFISYCPEIKKHPMHVIVMKREDFTGDIAMMLDGQKKFLAEHDERLSKIYFD